MAYKLFFTPEVDRKLEKMDVGVRKIILKWLKKNVDGCNNPKAHGKALSANRADQWRYRVGDHRVICLIDEGKLIVTAIDIGHRRDVNK
jgi:mRNA interferase RelE/StbE